MCMPMKLSNVGVEGLPTGPLADCSCCSAAGTLLELEVDSAEHKQLQQALGGMRPLPAINIDFCFGLPHSASCGTADLHLLPPNQQLFLDPVERLEVQDLLKTGSSVPTGPDRACSDFDAATALGRTSDKVGGCLGG